MTRLEQISIEIDKMVAELENHLKNEVYKNEVFVIDDSVRYLKDASNELLYAAKRN